MTISNSIKIISFKEEYATAFYQLNINWLEEYFYVEPHDREVLENPKTYIINRGGFIFFALLNNKVVGTVALINEKECFELSKMAISPELRGYKIGEKLLKHTLEFSKQQGWQKIMLYTNRSLKPAIHL